MFEELDVAATEQGELVLRRRRTPDGEVVYEVTLDGAFLMSSLVCDSERALATRAIAECATQDRALDVLVGGLGLGHTADAALETARVARLVVVDRLAPVIAWHRRGAVPLGERLAQDARTTFEHGDFFRRVGPDGPRDAFDVIAVDIDHSPRALLHVDHGAFYTPDGIAALRERLRPGGVFGFWSAAGIDDAFQTLLEGAFDRVTAETITFYNPHVSAEDVNTIYLGRVAPASR